eukprot:946798-Lingulodinium_polyedra.AAC.1
MLPVGRLADAPCQPSGWRRASAGHWARSCLRSLGTRPTLRGARPPALAASCQTTPGVAYLPP